MNDSETYEEMMEKRRKQRRNVGIKKGIVNSILILILVIVSGVCIAWAFETTEVEQDALVITADGDYEQIEVYYNSYSASNTKNLVGMLNQTIEEAVSDIKFHTWDEESFYVMVIRNNLSEPADLFIVPTADIQVLISHDVNITLDFTQTRIVEKFNWDSFGGAGGIGLVYAWIGAFVLLSIIAMVANDSIY